MLVRPQGGEPHLPVQPRLVRQAEARWRVQVAWVEIQQIIKKTVNNYLRRSTQVYKWHRKKWPFGKGGYEIE